MTASAFSIGGLSYGFMIGASETRFTGTATFVAPKLRASPLFAGALDEEHAFFAANKYIRRDRIEVMCLVL